MKILKLTLFLVLAGALTACGTKDERQAAALAKRVMGQQARDIIFKQVPSEKDTYELEQKGSKILIKGNIA